ncbi:MAG: hypothetical protein K2Y05_05835 [Hyphomicrobiaceae bacterium]|nr:hypothetical protein [Hyphomicrobiaceae bacterium]
MANLDENSFHGMWGTGGAGTAPDETGTRVLDPKAFDSMWFAEPKKEAGKGGVAEIGENRAAAVNVLRGIPILGAYADKGTAALNAAAQPFTATPGMSEAPTFSERMTENERRIKAGVDQFVEQRPIESTVGQVAGTVGAMAPAAATALGARALGMVGTLGQRVLLGGSSGAALNAADSAARSDGDLKNTLLGGGVGGAIGAVTPLAGRVIGAGVNKLMAPAADGSTNYLLQKAAQLGIPIRPAQVSTSPFVNKLDQMVPKIPGSGMGKAIGEQQEGFNRAVAKTFGEDATAITPEVMAAAKKRIGSEFDAVEKGTTVQFDQPLISKLDAVVRDASDVLEPGQVTPLAKRVGSIIDLAKNGEFDGKTFNNMMKKGAPLSRLQKSTDPNVQYYAGQIREALQDAIERSATPEMAQRYNLARLEYRNMKTIQPLAEKAATGNVSPLLLLNEVRKANPNFAYGSGGDLADLARIGQRFMKQPPDSGTPLGNKVLDLFTHNIPTLAGAAIGAGSAYSGGFDPVKDVGLGVGGLLATAAAARGAGRFMLRPEMIENALTRAPLIAPAVAPAVKNRLLENQAPQ